MEEQEVQETVFDPNFDKQQINTDAHIMNRPYLNHSQISGNVHSILIEEPDLPSLSPYE